MRPHYRVIDADGHVDEKAVNCLERMQRGCSTCRSKAKDKNEKRSEGRWA